MAVVRPTRNPPAEFALMWVYEATSSASRWRCSLTCLRVRPIGIFLAG